MVGSDVFPIERATFYLLCPPQTNGWIEAQGSKPTCLSHGRAMGPWCLKFLELLDNFKGKVKYELTVKNNTPKKLTSQWEKNKHLKMHLNLSHQNIVIFPAGHVSLREGKYAIPSSSAVFHFPCLRLTLLEPL